jgi:hypothetical protein
LEEVTDDEIYTMLDSINLGIVNGQFKFVRINVNGNNRTTHSSKLNGITADPGEAINDEWIGIGSGSDTPSSVANGNLFRCNGIPTFLIHSYTFIVSGEEMVPLKPILLNKWTHSFYFFFFSIPNIKFPFLMSTFN